jgi:DNA-binding NarL/FixJ family response regulator
LEKVPMTDRSEAEPGVSSPRRDESVIPVALIEDNRLVREGLTSLLNRVPGLKVVYGDAAADVARLERASPRVVLLDLGLEDGESLRVAETLGQALPECRVIVMDLLPVHEDIMDYVHVGVCGFIMKDASLEDLVDTIRSVAGGGDVLPPQMTSTLFSQIARDAVAKRGREALVDVGMTPRERQVISLISEGLSNKKIAARLHISVHTVKSHVRNIMEKLTLHTRLQIAAWAHDEEAE